ncbi:MAG: globin domain-containing protein [Planctomycetota bacterium]
MTQTSADRIRASFQLIAPKAAEVIDSFYANLFAAAPAVRAMFPEEMKEQKAHLLAALGLVVKHADNLQALREPLLAMGQRHVGYGAQPTHYAAVREVLLATLRQHAGSAWTTQLEDDWRGAINAVSKVMIEGQLTSASRVA